MKSINTLCIHGIGGKERTDKYKDKWQEEWKDAFVKMKFTEKVNINFMDFDHHFDKPNAKWKDYIKLFHESFFEKSLENRLDANWFDYSPDMVVEFLQNEDLRAILREELKNCISKTSPNVIYAHSLGSMICYDYFSHVQNDHYKDIILVTSGSQLGNPLLKNHGLIHPVIYLPVKFWFNLNNPKDWLFARHPIGLNSDSSRFEEIETLFFKKLINHDRWNYIVNENAKNKVWSKINQFYST